MNYRIAAREAADALYYLGKRDDDSKKPPKTPKPKIPPTPRPNQLIVLYKVFKRKTCKTTIHPVRFKGWKGER